MLRFFASLLLIAAVTVPSQAQCLVSRWGPGFHPVGAGAIIGGDILTVDVDGDGPMPDWLLSLGGTYLSLPSGQYYTVLLKYEPPNWNVIALGDPGISARNFRAAVAFQGRLFLGGGFSRLNGIEAPRLAAWNGTSWQSIWNGSRGFVHDMIVHDSKLFVAASNGVPGSQLTQNVRTWDGTHWQEIGQPLTGILVDLALSDQGELFGIEAFQSDGRARVVRFANNVWTAVTSDITMPFDFVGDFMAAEGVIAIATVAFSPNASNLFVWDRASEQWSSRCVGCERNRENYASEIFLWRTRPQDPVAFAVGGHNVIEPGNTQQYLFASSSSFKLDLRIPTLSASWAATMYQGELILPYERVITGIPFPLSQPRDSRPCRNAAARFSFTTSNTIAPPAYRWLRDGVTLVDGITSHGSVISGSQTAELTIANPKPQDVGVYTCLADNGACGSVTSSPAVLTLCRADYDCNGGVDSFDYLEFVADFAAESPSADFNANGTVDFFDYLDFVDSFATGC